MPSPSTIAMADEEALVTSALQEMYNVQKARADYLQAAVQNYAPHAWNDIRRELERKGLYPA